MQNVSGEIEQIKKRLDTLEALQFYKAKISKIEKEVMLPDYLYRTWHALKQFPNGATADDIARITERERAVESSHLNYLTVMGVIVKRRAGRKAVFTLTKKESG